VNRTDREDIFHRALADYRRGRLKESYQGFRLLVDGGSGDPKHLSYCGVLMVAMEGKVREGRALCERALTLNFYDPELHLNLSQVHLRDNRPDHAVQVLLRGIRLIPQDPRLRREIGRLKPRSTPVFSFLERNNPLNKVLGKARARLSALLAVN
jgi:predicted Zn-dependent protease